MKRVVLYDNRTVNSSYASAVCREILMRDALVARVVCGCMEESEWQAFSELGFVRAEEQENDSGSALLREQEETNPEARLDLLEMEILKAARKRTVDGIDLVTADATVKEVIRTARLHGKDVRVFGSRMDIQDTEQTQDSVCNASFVYQCDRFCYLEILRGGIVTGGLTPLAEILSDSYHIIIEERERNGALKLRDLYAALLRLHPEYDARNYGYAGLLELLTKNAPDLRTYKENGCTYLEYVDDREQVERFITNYLTKRDNKVEDMQELLDALTEEFDRFDTRLYGYTSDIAFFLSFPKLEIYNNKGVKLKQIFKLK